MVDGFWHLNNSNYRSRTVLITGASTGIGYECCKLFAADRYDLIIISRNGEILRQVSKELTQQYNVSVVCLAKDLSAPSVPQEMYDEIQRHNIQIDALVNNAGFATFGTFCETELQLTDEMIQVNVGALTKLTKLFLGDMVKRGSGKILNVASTAAFQPGPLMAAYYASKAYVLNFSEALRYELRGTGVTVTTLCPGPTRTEFQKRANMSASGLFKSPNVMDAKTVAEIGYRGMMNGDTIVIPGLINKFLAFFVRLLPRSFVLHFVMSYQKKRE
jgi:short-subunit dehydrogenase